MKQATLQPLVEQGKLSQQAYVVKPLHSDTNYCWLVADPASPLIEQREPQNNQHVGKETNDVANEIRWVLKHLRHDELSVSWDAFIQNTLQAEAQALTPHLEYANPETGCLLYRYSDADDLVTVDWPKAQKIEYLATALVKTHQSNMNFAPMDLYQEVNKYLYMIDDINHQSKFLAEMAKLPALPEANYFINDDLLRPAHMDLSFANVLSNGEILDWEYARQTLPLVDLAASATINQFNEHERQQLFNAYGQLSQQHESFETFEIYCVWCDLLNRIWYQVAAQHLA